MHTVRSLVRRRELVAAPSLTPVLEAAIRMREERFRHLPILDGNQVVGMVSMRDLLRDEIAEQREEIVGLHAYLHSTPL
ncbi:hypothetical protein MYXO_03995 [Myxococcaceae bacterium]|nr:hypothetical protein MYXO_03995 [Myxococcaceae bacterium]